MNNEAPDASNDKPRSDTSACNWTLTRRSEIRGERTVRRRPGVAVEMALVTHARSIGQEAAAVLQNLVDFDADEDFDRHFLGASIACLTVFP